MVGTPQSFGLFDAAAFVTPNLNGGNPNSGIAVGGKGIFTLELTGAGLDALTASSFLNLLSVTANNGDGETLISFAVGFQRTGLDGEGSDLAVATVPLPGAARLFGTASVRLADFARRRNKPSEFGEQKPGRLTAASGGRLSQDTATA